MAMWVGWEGVSHVVECEAEFMDFAAHIKVAVCGLHANLNALYMLCRVRVCSAL